MDLIEFDKINATKQEVEASFNFISFGLKNLKEQNSSLSNNHVALQLLASGFERIAKILLLLKDKYILGDFPELKNAKEKFQKYSNGHGIKEMLDELIMYGKTVNSMQTDPGVKAGLEFIESNKPFRKFLDIITQFSIQQRYFYIDTIVLNRNNTTSNPYEDFKNFIYSFANKVDLSQMSYEQEEGYILHKSISCIEIGVKAITGFFTHGLGLLGTQNYDNFWHFILLEDKDLGKLNYTIKAQSHSETYKPVNVFSFRLISIRLFSKSKTLYSNDYDNWPFTIHSVKIYSYAGTDFFAQIGNLIFSLTGKTSNDYKIPNYFKSPKLKPKSHAIFLLKEAKQLAQKN